MVTSPVADRVVTVPRLWPESTIVCVASGPSLLAEDVDYCRGRARVIAIKDAVRLAPWADVLYSGEIKWWKHYLASLTFEGHRYGIDVQQPVATVAMLRNTGLTGLESAPSGLRTGKNSGYQAINLAVHLGASKIVLLGYDMQPAANRDHWFGSHPYESCRIPYRAFLDCFETIVQPLQAANITVVNASRTTALRLFPCVSIEEALS